MAIATRNRTEAISSRPPEFHSSRSLLIGAAAVGTVALLVGGYLGYEHFFAHQQSLFPLPSGPKGFPAGGPDYHGPRVA